MVQIRSFTFNPFSENTYILYDEHKNALIIDPGMFTAEERNTFFGFIEKEGLQPIMLLNTHTHIDHIFGNAAVLKKFDIPFGFHKSDKPVFDAGVQTGAMYNLPFERSPEPGFFLKEGEEVVLGSDKFKILFTPGHSPGSVCFYHEPQGFVISGDVLFQMSIGRSDFPGGNHDVLMNSIHTQLMTLPDQVKVYSGHGPETTIGMERMNNPFVTGQ